MKRAAIFLALLLLAACGRAGEARLQGYAEADYVYLAPREAGYVKSLSVKEGDEIAAGAPVFELDEKRAQAALSGAEAQARASRLNAAALAQQIAEARADLALAQANFDRTKALHDKDYASKAQLDADRAARDAAAARVRTASAQQRAPGSGAVAASADAAVAQEQAGDRRVRAPAAGRIENIYRRPGEFVQAGDPVAALLPPGAMKLRFFIPERLLARTRLGDVVNVACDSCAGDLKARVYFIASAPQFTPPVIYSAEERDKLVYLVEARPVGDARFRPGQPVDVRFPK